MLQQTRVSAAIPYFERWTKRFPSALSLSSASEEDVLKAWEGLGYYSRARNLHAAAKIIASEFGGELPCDKEALLRLPGIGEYTVGAILSIAFGKREPAVDGNVLRVISRLTEDPTDILNVSFRKKIADDIRPFMKEGETSDFTQALFELGALVCLPEEACRCASCPVRAFCGANEHGTQSLFPVKTAKKEKKKAEMTVFLLLLNGSVALTRRPDSGLLAKMYQFPNVSGFLSASEVSARFGGEARELPAHTHVFTHVIWEMKAFAVSLSSPPNDPTLFFASPAELEEKYALPSAFSFYKKFCK